MDRFSTEAGRDEQPRPRPLHRLAAARAPIAASLPIELACLESLIDPTLLQAVARRAEAIGVGGDEVVRAHGLLAPDEILRALAARLGLGIDPLDDHAPPHTERILEAALKGVIRRSAPGTATRITVAPRGAEIGRLAQMLTERPELARGLRLSSPERLSAYVRRVGATELAREAVLGLYQRRPDLSAGARHSTGPRLLAGAIAGCALGAILFFPAASLLAAELMLAGCFLAWTLFRLSSCALRPRETVSLPVPEHALPVYTIVVPLYREARVVREIVGALCALDYPLEKLDIKLVVEVDDPDTRQAIAALGLRAPFEEIVAPRAGPRTKPKALAAALPFARGRFLVVYDAEDRPDSDQLRRALAAFRAAPSDLACVQARLAIDNAADSWLTRQYAAEYAGLFDVFLPAIAALRLPLPLGGSSNHFRMEILRKVGGWDPFNVTEDTDLGVRLARAGYRVAVIDSTTEEEAPWAFVPWLRQRTRWFKGWMQTYLVHMRAPRRLLAELGWKGFIAFQLVVAGTVLAALVHPFFLGLLAYDAATQALLAPGAASPDGLRRALALVVLTAGYLASLMLGVIGLRRRKMLALAPALATIPAYWLLLSLAAWRALFQFAFAPYKWEKTEHGLARTSRRETQRAPLPPAAGAVRSRRLAARETRPSGRS